MPSAVLDLILRLKDEASSGLASVRSAMGTLGAVAGGAAVAGVAALGAAIVAGVGDAREAAGVMAQTEAVIKSTGGAAGFTAEQIGEMAGALSAAEGKSLFGDSDIQRGQNLLLTFTNITETLPETTGVMIDMAQAMGTDVAGGAIQLGKALNDPIAGVGALSEVGVTFTAQQKEQIKAMQEAGDMAGAQRVILAELNKEFGGSAEAAAKADGGLTQFKDRLGELAEGVGAALLPALNQVTALLNSPEVMDGLQAFADGLSAGIGIAVEVIGSGLAAAQPYIEMFAGALAGMGDSSAGVGAALALVAAAIQTYVIDVFNSAAALVSAVMGVIVQLVSQNSGQMSADFGAMGAQVAAVISTMGQIVSTIFGGMAAFIVANQGQIVATLQAAWALISSIVGTALSVMQGVVTTVMAIISGNWSGAWAAIQQTCATIVTGIAQIVYNGLNLIATAMGTSLPQLAALWSTNMANIQRVVSEAISAVLGYFSNLGSQISAATSTALGAVKSFSSGVTSSLGYIKSAIDGVIGYFQRLADKLSSLEIPDWLQGHSPPPMAEWLMFIADALQVATDKGFGLGSMMDGLQKKGRDFMKGAFGGIASMARQELENLEALEDFAGKGDLDKRRGKSEDSFLKEQDAILTQQQQDKLKNEQALATLKLEYEQDAAAIRTKEYDTELERQAALNNLSSEYAHERVALETEGRNQAIENETALNELRTAHSAEIADFETEAIQQQHRQALAARAEQELAAAKAQADALGDNELADQFYALRSKQILDLAQLSADADEANLNKDYDREAQLRKRIALEETAQAADLAKFQIQAQERREKVRDFANDIDETVAEIDKETYDKDGAGHTGYLNTMMLVNQIANSLKWALGTFESGLANAIGGITNDYTASASDGTTRSSATDNTTNNVTVNINASGDSGAIETAVRNALRAAGIGADVRRRTS